MEKNKKHTNWKLSLIPLITPLIILSFTRNTFEIPKIFFFTSISSIIAIFCIFKINQKGKLQINKKLLIFSLSYIAILLISTIFSIAPLESIFGSNERFQGIILEINFIIYALILSSILNTKDKIKYTLKFSVLVASIVAIFGLLEHIKISLIDSSQIQLSGFFGRSFSSLGHPNILGQFLLINLWPSIYLIKNEKTKFPYLISTTLIFSTLILTKNRASLIALLLSGLIYLLINKNISKRAKVLIASLSLISISSFIYFFASSMRSLNSRLYIWESIIKGIKDSPLIGYGFENIKIVYQKFLNPEIYKFESLYTIADRSHNEFLDIIIQTGFIGLIMYLMPLFFILKKFKKIKNSKLNLSIFTAIIASYISLLFSFSLTSQKIIYFSLTFILISRLYKDKTLEIKRIPLLFSISAITLVICNIYIFSSQFLSDVLYQKSLKTNNIHYQVLASDIYPFQSTLNYQIAYTLAAEKDKKAYQYLDKAKRFTNTNFIYLIHKALIEKDFGNTEESLKAFSASLHLAANYPQTLFLKGKTEFENQKYEESISTFESLIKIIPNYWKYGNQDLKIDLINYYKYYLSSPEIEEISKYLEQAYKKTNNKEKENYYKKIRIKKEELEFKL